MKIIGLTGGIGAGKSTASSILKEYGCIILDADAISREMTSEGSEVLDDIAGTFGPGYVSNGVLDRKALGMLVFNDKNALTKLRSLITDKVADAIMSEIRTLKKEDKDGIVIIDAPLLFECGLHKITDENWLVSSNMDVRIKRVSARDGLSEQEILSRINSQMSEEEKKSLSQQVLDNSGTVDQLRLQIACQLERIKNEIQQK